MIRILHVLGGLETGGAELFLERLAQALDIDEFDQRVVSVTDLGTVGARLRAAGTRVDALHTRGVADAPWRMLKLRKLIQDIRPDLVQGWMYHGNLAASAALRMSRVRCPLLWNIRHSLDGWSREKLSLRGEVWLEGHFARWPEHIVFNSGRSARQHESLGFPREKARVILNGFDLDKFSQDEAAGSRVRTELGVGVKDVVLGMVGRYHPLKDHVNFLSAARAVVSVEPNVKFVLIGRGVTDANPGLVARVKESQLEGRVLLLGERHDIANLLNALDVYVSPSLSEAFPNTVGEAMSCGVPCVVTDVGESGELVADTGIVVPARSPEQLAEGMLQMICAGAEKRKALGATARERIRVNYSNEKVARQYADLYHDVCRRA